jgi:hypothetical protein
MPDDVRSRLDALVARHRINAAIISTEPLAHGAYLEYALRSGLHVLVDKPLTTRHGVAHDPAQARGIWADYREVRRLYGKLQDRRRTCLLVNSHRRYHPGFQKVFELIADIRDRFGCPVTHIASEHCDGQWRLPAEIVSQDYHPYNRGYGKVSHSGYHALDMVACFLRAGSVPGKEPDALRVTSSFVLPEGFLVQMGRDDYRRYFGPAYDQVCPYADDDLRARVAGFGEIDATALLEYSRGGVAVGSASVSLLHNGFSRRSWVRPGADLYKGNGRVRHERHRITSGPFQTVYVESYQASDKHERSTSADYERGGNNHFDIAVYRNSDMTGDAEPQRIYRFTDLPGVEGFDAAGLHNEQVKEAALQEFLRFLRGDIPVERLRSNIESHELTVRLMSAVYLAHALRRQGKRGWVRSRMR